VAFLQPADIVDDGRRAGLDASVIAVDRPMAADRGVPEVPGRLLGDEALLEFLRIQRSEDVTLPACRGSGRSSKCFRKTKPSPIAPSIAIVASHAKSAATRRFRTLPPRHQLFLLIALGQSRSAIDATAVHTLHFGYRSFGNLTTSSN
jgi:hypothetical protein